MKYIFSVLVLFLIIIISGCVQNGYIPDQSKDYTEYCPYSENSINILYNNEPLGGLYYVLIAYSDQVDISEIQNSQVQASCIEELHTGCDTTLRLVKVTKPQSSEQYGPAEDEPVGATRTDYNGWVWTKGSDGMWSTPSAPETKWGDVLIDQLTLGGTHYVNDLSREIGDIQSGINQVVRYGNGLTEENIIAAFRSYSADEPEYFEVENAIKTQPLYSYDTIVDIGKGEIISSTEEYDEELLFPCRF